MCKYFDDLIIDNNYEYQLKNDWIPKEEYSLIIEWHIKLGKYESPNNDEYDSESILRDKTWRDIVEEGVEMKNKLEKILNPKEVDILNNKTNYLDYK